MLDRRLLIVTGKGGVGRSVVASAIARSRAARGERVLAIAIDRGAGLAAHLGQPGLGAKPTEVDDGLHAAVVDPSSALEEYVRLRVGAAPIAMAGRVFGVLAATVPGVRDIVLVGKVAHEAQDGGWDAVVVDAPPAGQIQSLLDAPQTIAQIVPRGTVHDHAEQVGAVIGDSGTTGIVVVATPEELALAEAEEVLRAADAAGATESRQLVVNRVLPDPGFDEAPPSAGPRREAATLHLEVRASQQRLLSGHSDALTLPLLFGIRRPTATSTRLAELLEAT